MPQLWVATVKAPTVFLQMELQRQPKMDIRLQHWMSQMKITATRKHCRGNWSTKISRCHNQPSTCQLSMWKIHLFKIQDQQSLQGLTKLFSVAKASTCMEWTEPMTQVQSISRSWLITIINTPTDNKKNLSHAPSPRQHTTRQSTNQHRIWTIIWVKSSWSPRRLWTSLVAAPAI